MEIRPKPPKVKDSLEVRALDERERLLWRSALRRVSRLRQLAAEPIHLGPGEEGQPDVLSGVLEQDVNPLLFDRIHQQ